MTRSHSEPTTRSLSGSSKVCRECGAILPLSSFYTHHGKTDGHLSKCKPCVRDRVKRHRNANIDAVRAYDRQRFQNNPERRTVVLARLKGLRQQSPNAYKAHSAVSNALRDRRLTRKPCEECGVTKNVFAHHDDYLKPLEVRWLCQSHHAHWHIANGPGANK